MEVQRTQMYLRPDQRIRLREQSHRMGVSLTEILRQALDEFLSHSPAGPAERSPGLANITGLGKSPTRDGARRHDHYLADAIGHRLTARQ
jgi:hypothetical protein